jgi:hypothetical protein
VAKYLPSIVTVFERSLFSLLGVLNGPSGAHTAANEEARAHAVSALGGFITQPHGTRRRAAEMLRAVLASNH